ncbi:hypothetical protein BLS_004074 [Venturia inaequalis]|uniref:TMEM205-like domain-containing protein n=1 Tax=Venturia inaequalis TaxID=5025 RepID=A0A8H3VG05_VENIN|nr:hypothetical protein BLS_004074 [Venturia inaequalis]KAE9979994.1 hypothetical protein EG327_006728 [Venturia inaequalis]KAE9988394.1 hypothetical protein EG328_011154 [Venturia inaequalis]
MSPTNPSTYHILSYGTLLGTSIFQSFVGGILSYRALPRPQFATLQSALFPTYFGMQTILPIIMALTYKSTSVTSPSVTHGFKALLNAPSQAPLYAMTGMAFCGLTNWLILGPLTTSTMKTRKHQETKDGKKYYENGPQSKEMQALNTKFSWLHGISSTINTIEMGVMFWYGSVLASRLV